MGSRPWNIRSMRCHTLKDLEILKIGVLGVDIELHTRHGNIHCTREPRLASHTQVLKPSGSLKPARCSLTEYRIKNLTQSGPVNPNQHFESMFESVLSFQVRRGMVDDFKGTERSVQSYPVPHCSILVRFSCSRLLIHASSSCLYSEKCSN
jgi:hypothetical protein